MGLVEDALVHVSPQSAGLALGVGTVLYFTYKKIDEVSRLSKLGPRGQRIASKLPFGMTCPSVGQPTNAAHTDKPHSDRCPQGPGRRRHAAQEL